MATLVKLRGLNRVNTAGTGAVISNRGFRVRDALGLQYPAGVKASLTPTANTQTYTAKYGGTYGNSISVQTVVGTLGVNVTFASGTGLPTVVVTAPATATLAANQAVVAAVNAHPTASQYVTASIAGTGAAAHAAVAATALSGGTNVGTAQTIERTLAGAVTVIVDLDDAFTLRQLRRNQAQYISLGQA